MSPPQSGNHPKDRKMNLFRHIREMNILLIDDDEWIRNSMSIYFEFEGCRLRTFETAEEGLEELERHKYELIIIDYKLPGMDGLEFLKRSQKTHPDSMKILITAYGNRELFSEAYKLGARDIINKPFTIEAVEESLNRLIENREQHI